MPSARAAALIEPCCTTWANKAIRLTLSIGHLRAAIVKHSFKVIVIFCDCRRRRLGGTLASFPTPRTFP